MEQSAADDFSRAGFARLLKSFEDNTDDVVKLTRAFGLAAKVYKSMPSRNEPHINHPLRIAIILAEELQIRDAELASAAILLHGTELPEEDLASCGERVPPTVRAAAEPKTREEKALAEYFGKIAKAPKDARYVAVAGRLDTVRSMKHQGLKDSVMRYKEETEKYVMAVASATDDRLAFKLSVALYELKK